MLSVLKSLAEAIASSANGRPENVQRKVVDVHSPDHEGWRTERQVFSNHSGAISINVWWVESLNQGRIIRILQMDSEDEFYVYVGSICVGKAATIEAAKSISADTVYRLAIHRSQ